MDFSNLTYSQLCTARNTLEIERAYLISHASSGSDDLKRFYLDRAAELTVVIECFNNACVLKGGE